MSDDYDNKYMKIKFYSDDELTLNKAIEIPMIIFVRPVFYENNKYYPQFLLDKCFYELQTRKQKQLQQILMKKCSL